MFLIFVRIALVRHFKQYPKYVFYEEIKIKQVISYISLCACRTHYNIKFILMTRSPGPNAVVVRRVHCNTKQVSIKSNGEL